MASPEGGGGAGAAAAARPACSPAIVAARRHHIQALAQVNLAVARYRATEAAAQLARQDVSELERRLAACDGEIEAAARVQRQTQTDYVGILAEYLCETQAVEQLFCDDVYMVTQAASVNQPEPQILDAAARLNRFAGALETYFFRRFRQAGATDVARTVEEARRLFGGSGAGFHGSTFVYSAALAAAAEVGIWMPDDSSTSQTVWSEAASAAGASTADTR